MTEKIHVNSTEFQEPTSSEIKLSFCIPVYGQQSFTQSLIKDLLKLPNTYEIVICDNNSPDDTYFIVNDLIAARKPEQAQLVYIRAPENLMHSGGSNKCFKEAKGQNICFLNNDVRVQKDHASWAEVLIEPCQAGKIVGPTGGLLNSDFEFLKESNVLEDSPYSYLSGWCVAGSRETFNKLRPDHFFNFKTGKAQEGLSAGPWDDSIFYGNDMDLAIRARKLNIPLEIIDLPLKHFGRITTKGMKNTSKLYLEGVEKLRVKYGKLI